MRVTGRSLSKEFYRKSKDSNVFTAVQSTDIELEPGKIVLIGGRSGGGKSTLLNMLSGILTPTSGTVLYDDTDIFSLSDDLRSRFRNRHIGYIPQGTSAISSLSVRENILLPLTLSEDKDIEKDKVIDRAEHLMEEFDILSLSDEKPAGLSGGEQRRMAVARALLFSPEVIFADEPTGDLDDENTALVFKVLKSFAKEGASVLIVTHERETEGFSDVRYRMDAGVLYA